MERDMDEKSISRLDDTWLETRVCKFHHLILPLFIPLHVYAHLYITIHIHIVKKFSYDTTKASITVLLYAIHTYVFEKN